jgi:3-hydroxyisobutyrate dehydrogenase-like beta-hydroxyacid dehydrogenase
MMNHNSQIRDPRFRHRRRACRHIVICIGAVDVHALRALGADLATEGIMDAPVSGGTKGAEAGTLSVICGGPAKASAASEAMWCHGDHMGDSGAGGAMKLINNMLLQIQWWRLRRGARRQGRA